MTPFQMLVDGADIPRHSHITITMVDGTKIKQSVFMFLHSIVDDSQIREIHQKFFTVHRTDSAYYMKREYLSPRKKAGFWCHSMNASFDAQTDEQVSVVYVEPDSTVLQTSFPIGQDHYSFLRVDRGKLASRFSVGRVEYFYEAEIERIHGETRTTKQVLSVQQKNGPEIVHHLPDSIDHKTSSNLLFRGQLREFVFHRLFEASSKTRFSRFSKFNFCRVLSDFHSSQHVDANEKTFNLNDYERYNVQLRAR